MQKFSEKLKDSKNLNKLTTRFFSNAEIETLKTRISRKQRLEDELKYWKMQRERSHRRRRGYFSISVFAIVSTTLLLSIFLFTDMVPDEQVNQWLIPIAGIGMLYISFSLLMALVTPIGTIEGRIIELRDEIDLLNIQDTLPEQRAEKQFKLHQSELKRYYDQSLKHSSLLFFVGLGNLIIGFSIVGISLYLVYSGKQENTVVIAVLGGVAGVITNFIGAIYLKMYSETIRSSNEFHNRLVTTHHLHFSNFLLSKIKDDVLREETLSKLALSLTLKENSIENTKEHNNEKAET